MKIKINRKENKDCGFPKLMIDKYNGVIILAVDQILKDIIGHILHIGNTNWSVGQFSKQFSADEFTDFNGSITLENGEN